MLTNFKIIVDKIFNEQYLSNELYYYWRPHFEFDILRKKFAYDKIKLLIEDDYDVNYQDARGYTLLSWALIYKADQIIDLLLEYNANPFLPNNYNESLLSKSLDISGHYTDGINIRHFKVIQKFLVRYAKFDIEIDEYNYCVNCANYETIFKYLIDLFYDNDTPLALRLGVDACKQCISSIINSCDYFGVNLDTKYLLSL